MISCLMITQAGRLPEVARATRCFARQTLLGCELVVVHDGGKEFDAALRGLASRHPDAEIRVVLAEPGRTLGALRNLSVEQASHPLVCQWDDDDLYHPRRLEVQMAELERRGADFCFLTDQLHWFEPTGEMFWDDWSRERFPMSLIQGTLMGRRSELGPYPDLPRGEDTAALVELVRRGCRITALQDQGYLYIYVFNGKNAWDLDHHRSISQWKARPRAHLLDQQENLRRHLREYDLRGQTVTMPYEGGSLRFPLWREAVGGE